MGGGGSSGSEGALESVRPAIRWDPQKVCPSPGTGTGQQLETRLWDKVSPKVTCWSGAERGYALPIFRVTTPLPPGESSLGPLAVAFPGCCAPFLLAVPRLRAWNTWPPALTCPVPLPAGPRPHPHPVSAAGSGSRAGALPRPQALSFPGTAYLPSHSSRRLGAEAWGFCLHESKQTAKASFPPSRAQQGWLGHWWAGTQQVQAGWKQEDDRETPGNRAEQLCESSSPFTGRIQVNGKP